MKKNAIWLDLKVSIKKLFTIVLQRILRYGILIKYTRYWKHSVYFQKIGKMIEKSLNNKTYYLNSDIPKQCANKLYTLYKTILSWNTIFLNEFQCVNWGYNGKRDNRFDMKIVILFF